MKQHLTLAFAVLLTAAPTMAFCDVPQPRLVCAEYFASQVVVEATLIQIQSVSDKDDPEGISAYVYTLQAGHLLRGHIARRFKVYEGNDSGRATFDWKIGREYLLFLYTHEADKGWKLDGCGNSGPLDHAKMALEEIARIQKLHGDGFIHGLVSWNALSNPMADVRVEAHGANGTYTATTDANGEFEIKVPPGRYAVRALKSGFSFSGADISYSDPSDIRIEPGGCAQVQLAANQ
jgi:Carboxypeptidase regulatory-like domain